MNYDKQLKEVMPYFVHRGCLVNRLIGGFELWGEKYLIMEEVDKVIDNSLKNLEKSIVNADNNE